MAQPIPLNLPPTDRSKDLAAKLEGARLKHTAAVLAAYELLQELHDNGVLDLLRGATSAGGDIVTRLSSAADTPESVAVIRNAISMLRILSSIDPELLHGLADAVSKIDARPDAWSTIRRLFSKETFRAIGAMAYGLHAFGSVLISKQRASTRS
jgi:uncharacterized protein YjgD (DUF1641 family)